MPVFVDIEPRTFNIDPLAIQAKITKRTRAILPVHLFGQMADMDAIGALARKHELPIIEDAAQAIGAEHRGQRAGSIGTMGCFSFYPSKNLGGCGDGGMVTTNDEAVAENLRRLRSHGFRTRYFNEVIGGNFRLDEIQAAVLRVKLKHLDDWTNARQRNAAIYRTAFADSDQVQLPFENPDSRHIYNQFVIRSKHRDEIMARLKQKEIGCEVYYPVSLHLQDCFKYLDLANGSFPHSETAAAESLALPIYPELTLDQIQTVTSSVLEKARKIQ
jgi:dTDP-4-amino-4,6-dideoxygalactose transaminase